MFEEIFEDVVFDILLVVVGLGTGGGETLGRLIFCECPRNEFSGLVNY